MFWRPLPLGPPCQSPGCHGRPRTPRPPGNARAVAPRVTGSDGRMAESGRYEARLWLTVRLATPSSLSVPYLTLAPSPDSAHSCWQHLDPRCHGVGVAGGRPEAEYGSRIAGRALAGYPVAIRSARTGGGVDQRARSPRHADFPRGGQAITYGRPRAKCTTKEMSPTTRRM